MTARGRVREWHDDEGWGVVDSDDAPLGCWTHFSAVLVPGYRRLEAGQEVSFTFEVAEQDGFSFRALEAWPAGAPPGGADPEEPGAAHESTLTVTFDQREEHDERRPR